ncbi:hypothetical protein CFP56_035818 [Quercus suber]|uniref:MATH domain-containing protein n=1 Tax=Quercus suber TaxID=58331 RepID=A0AAW0LP35_QUESU
MGQGLSVGIDDLVCPINAFVRKGSKNLNVDSSKIEIYWTLTNAKFGSGLEPVEGLFSCCVLSGNSFTSKREHIFGRRFYGAKTKFCDKGNMHDVTIECDILTLLG